MKKLFLKANVKVEPTINCWYAWALLVSPITLSLISRYHLILILESYIRSPQLHVQAVNDPNMLGGPFIDTKGEDKVSEITDFLEKTNVILFEQHKLAENIKFLAEELKEKATGKSLDDFYKSLPECLAGYVEFHYNLSNYPGFRIFEGLIYNSNYYQPNLQKISLSPICTDDRPFVLSTPILSNEESVEINLPFESEVYDKIFSAKEKPLLTDEVEIIKEQYIDKNMHEKFMQLFTDIPQAICSTRYQGPDARVRYFGHACLLIETRDISILIDPLISYDYETTQPRYSFKDLPEHIDYILITHAHQDHFVIETLLQIRHKVRQIIVPKNNKESLADPSLKIICHKLGFKNCIEIDELESVFFPGGEIIGIPFLGEHGDLNIYSKLGYIIRVGRKHIFCSADSNNLDNKLYEHIKGIIPKIDIMFLGMECDGAPFSWLYGSLLLNQITHDMDQSRRLSGSDADKAYAIIETFSCPEVYIYAMGQEPWLKFISSIEYTENSKPIIESEGLLRYCDDCNIKVERLYGSKEIYLLS